MFSSDRLAPPSHHPHLLHRHSLPDLPPPVPPHGTFNPSAPYGSSYLQHSRYPSTMQQLQQPFAYGSLQQPQLQPLQQYRSQEWPHPQFSPASSSSLWSPGSSGIHHHNRSGSSLTVPSFHHTVPRRVKVRECEKELNGALQKMLRGEGLEGGGRGMIRGDWEWRRSAMPLIQITTLINCKESLMGAKGRSEKAIRAALKVGSAVESAIERFVAVGETIADENPDVQPEMYDACHEARLAGASMSNLSCMPNEGMNGPESAIDKQVIVRASRQLLSSVTRVLLLADRVLVKQIVRAEDKVAYSLSRLETTRSFTDFVKIFAEFGGEMVDLAHRSGDRQHDLKSEKRRAQMGVARTSLERTTMLLLTSSKCLLRHPESESARQCRDGVFYQMRVALQLIATCISDGVLPIETDRYCPSNPDEPLDIGIQLTANAAIRQLTEMLDMVRMTSRVGTGVRERLVSAIDALCELTQDFTDSAYTTHHHREQVLDFLEECRFEMTNLIQPEVSSRDDTMDVMRNEGLEVTVERLNRRLRDLSKQLQIVAMEQLSEVFGANEDQVLMSSIKACAVSGDIDGVEKYLDKFREHAEHMQEVCRLLHHISITDGLHVSTGHCERNMRAFAPLTLLAGRTLCMHPSSRIARENLEVFCDTWSQILNDLSRLTKESDAASNGRLAAERQAYMSLPRPGKHGTTQKPSKPITLDVEDQQKMAKVGLEMKLLTSEVDAEAEKWDEYAENDIVKRAKAMSSMAYNMYLFTRGDGPLKTTHDLFTQAEFFAEQANKMYKTVREFSYEVPGSAEKSELATILEKIPIHCQQLQVLVKSPTVGKAATFGKVDSVIQETKNLMNEIAKLVTASFVCATKFEIEFRGSSMPRSLHGGDPFESNGYGGASRESTLWRRTPSIRRTAPPPIRSSVGPSSAIENSYNL